MPAFFCLGEQRLPEDLVEGLDGEPHGVLDRHVQVELYFLVEQVVDVVCSVVEVVGFVDVGHWLAVQRYVSICLTRCLRMLSSVRFIAIYRKRQSSAASLSSIPINTRNSEKNISECANYYILNISCFLMATQKPIKKRPGCTAHLFFSTDRPVGLILAN